MASSQDFGARLYIIDSTDMAELARKWHDMTPVASAALGRAISAASMLGVMMKGERDKLTLQIKGDGPLGLLVCTTNPTGNVKAYVMHPDADLPIRDDGKLDVGAAVGSQGSLSIIRDYGLKEPYIGTYPLVNGEIAEDLNAYLYHSEQVASAVGLGVHVNPDWTIGAAGGFILQLLPDASEELVAELEQNIASLPPVSQLILEGKTPEEIGSLIMGEQGFVFNEEREVEYFCDCSKERMQRAMISLGKQELDDIIEEDGQAELICHFCNKTYHFTKPQLQSLASETKH